MNKLVSLILLISLIASIVPGSIQAAPSVPAFPGAEGWGAQSIGGRGGQVYEITNLNDKGPGSLRACVNQSIPRTCVFRVAGIINLERRINIKNPYVTIAGQTAPGDGITLIGGPNDRAFMISTHNVIIRYLRFRGDAKSFVTVRPWNDAHNIIVDHCSASGGEDDIFDLNYNTTGATDPDIRDITIQNCVIAEAHAVHPTGLLTGGLADLSVDPPIIGNQIHHISVNRNFFVHNGWRNPLIKSFKTEVINNVVYNWSNRIGGAGASAEVDFINNYWKAGPMKGSNTPLVFEWFDNEQREFPLSSIYIAGNIIPSLGAFTVTDPNKDNWPLFRTNEGRFGDQYKGKSVPEDNRRFTPLAPAPYPVTIQPALAMFNSVVTDAGANKRLNGDGTFTDNRDEVDQQFIDEFNSGTGLTSTPTTIRIASFIDPGTPYADTDEDGMADEWENIHFGSLAVGSASDSSSDNDGDGYTDLEEFLNGTDPKSGAATPPTPPPSPTPVPLSPTPPGPPPPPVFPPPPPSLPGGDTVAPTIFDIQPTEPLPAGTKEVTISLQTNENAQCAISQTPGVVDEPTATLFTTTGETTHSITIPGLVEGQPYTAYVRCQDTAGNITTQDTLIEFSIDEAPAQRKVPRLPMAALLIILLGIGVGTVIVVMRKRGRVENG